MSGPCTDCGGPDYQTLLARIAELEAGAGTSICIFCGTTMDKDLHVMLDHAEGCEKRPENNLLKRAEQAEAALAERDRMLAKEYESSTPRMAGYMRWFVDLRARAEEGSET